LRKTWARANTVEGSHALNVIALTRDKTVEAKT
jgi:hypothetical protein